MCSCAGCTCKFWVNQNSNAVLHQTDTGEYQHVQYMRKMQTCHQWTCTRACFISTQTAATKAFMVLFRQQCSFNDCRALQSAAILGCSLFFQLEHITQSLCTLPFVAVVM